jgi:hypothetical protein
MCFNEHTKDFKLQQGSLDSQKHPEYGTRDAANGRDYVNFTF